MAIKGGNCIEALLRIGVFLLLKTNIGQCVGLIKHSTGTPTQQKTSKLTICCIAILSLKKCFFAWGTETDAS